MALKMTTRLSEKMPRTCNYTNSSAWTQKRKYYSKKLADTYTKKMAVLCWGVG